MIVREPDRIVFMTKEPYTEELSTWWVWHTPGLLSTTLEEWVEVQIGSDGQSNEYREVRINHVAVDKGFWPLLGDDLVVSPDGL